MIVLKVSTFWLIALYGLVCPESVGSEPDIAGKYLVRFKVWIFPYDRRSHEPGNGILL